MVNLRSLPSIDQLLQTIQVEALIAEYGRTLTLDALRNSMDEARHSFNGLSPLPDQENILERASQLIRDWTSPTLKPVINATGVILHTNLGRALLSKGAIQAAWQIAQSYSNLEYDLHQGKRGSRLDHAEPLLQRLTGAESALVVNNNAAAVLLILTVLAKRRAVVIARSQLVEIGGGFRIPEIMKQSGAKLVEVGSTNRVYLADYEQALESSPALILRAHRSNFRILGFISEPALSELAALSKRAGIPLADDLGSGSLLETERFGLGHEPMVQESLQAGADLVCFSGDKLLGGPQAGVIVGRADLINRLKRHPLARALRADKLCLASLSATLSHYLKDEALDAIPVWRMISTPLEALYERAQDWAKSLGQGQVIQGESTVGGGSLPGETLPTYLLALEVDHPNRFLARLREGNPPVIARLENDRLVFDPRTVLPEEEKPFLELLGSLLE